MSRIHHITDADAPDASPDTTGWATFIGIIICLCGNVIISFALNLQRLAHERIQRRITQRNIQSETYGSNCSTTSKGDDEDVDEQGTQYLQSKLWWTGLVLMAIGETGNFVAYGFAPASIVAPLGTVAILCNALVAPLVFHETFRLRDFTGIVLSTAGAVTIVLSAKTQEEKLSPEDIWKAITETAFLIYFATCCVVATILVYLSRRHGEKSITIDLGLVAIFGGFTALSTKGISSLLSLSLYRIFTFPIAYLLLFILTSTAILQVKYLNKALARFSSTQVIPTQFVMFTLSVVLGSSILYKDFNSATPQRLLKFIFGCLSTFIGVYLITSKRHVQRLHKHHLSQASLRQPQQSSPQCETAPLMVVGSATSSSNSDNLGETPPHLIGTSFGYHFTSPRILERRTSRSTLPRHPKQRNDLASAIWSTWRHSENEQGELLRPEGMGRTQSDRPATTTNGGEAWRRNEDSRSEILQDGRESWGRNRGYSVV